MRRMNRALQDGYVSSLTFVVKNIEVDPRVPGNRDEFLFPQAKQCSPELDSSGFRSECPFSQSFTVPREKLICNFRKLVFNTNVPKGVQ